MSSKSSLDLKFAHLQKLLITWRKLRKLPRGQVDDESLPQLGILTSRINEDGTGGGTATRPRFFKPMPQQEFEALPEYDLDTEFPQYRDRDDRNSYGYETGCYLFHFFWYHLFQNEWKTQQPDFKHCLHLHSNWTPANDPEHQVYGNNGGSAADTEWLLPRIWEHLKPARPHVMGTLINDIESEDTLVPTELLALVKLIMVTTNMKRWIEHKVYPVLLISILAKQQVRIIEGYFDGKNVIVNYSKLHDFRDEKTAPVSLILRLFLCQAVGNTMELEDV